jgi:hypothetical protein
MLHETNLTGMSTGQLEALHTHLACAFWDDISEEARDDISAQIDTVKNCLPASFVLSSLFDVEAMYNEIPEHVLESDPSLEWVTCPCCDGEKWLEVEGNGWCEALFEDPRKRYVYGHLNRSSKPCTRCGASGEVLGERTSDFVIAPTLEPVWLVAA